MKNRLNTGLIVHARRVLVIGVPAVGLALAMVGVVPAQQALAQESSGGSIDGDTTTIGGISVESNTLEFGEGESTAISDASGGHHNVSEKSGSHDE
jgi:hypothetical protein